LELSSESVQSIQNLEHFIPYDGKTEHIEFKKLKHDDASTAHRDPSAEPNIQRRECCSTPQTVAQPSRQWGKQTYLIYVAFMLLL